MGKSLRTQPLPAPAPPSYQAAFICHPSSCLLAGRRGGAKSGVPGAAPVYWGHGPPRALPDAHSSHHWQIGGLCPHLVFLAGPVAVPRPTGVLAVKKKGEQYGVAIQDSGPESNASYSEMGLERHKPARASGVVFQVSVGWVPAAATAFLPPCGYNVEPHLVRRGAAFLPT